jgi:hypothetical protein
LSDLTGIPIYNLAQFTYIFLVALTALMMYYLLKRGFNNRIAIFSCIAFPFLYYKGLTIGIFWGHWGAIMGYCYLAFMIYLIYHFFFKERNNIVIAIGLISLFLIFPILLFPVALFFIAYYIHKYLKKNLDMKKELISIMIIAIIVIAFSSIYSYVFLEVYNSDGTSLVDIKVNNQLPSPYPTHITMFPIYIYALVILGLGISFFIRKNFLIYPLLIAFLYGFTTYIFGGNLFARANHLKLVWPIYFAPFLGIGIYQLSKSIKIKGLKEEYFYLLPLAMLFIILPANSLAYSPGMLGQDEWEFAEWSRNNLDYKDKVMMFFNERYSQDMVMGMADVFYFHIAIDEIGGMISNNSAGTMPLPRYITGIYNTDSYLGGTVYETSTLRFSRAQDDFSHLSNNKKPGKVDLCNMDYFKLNFNTQYQEVQVYYDGLAKQFQKYGMKLVYNNKGVLLYENKEECPFG